MSELQSKMFKAVSYADGTLSVTFHNGKTYHHDDVSEDTHKQMMAAPSLGQFYNGQIKKAHPARKT